MFWNRLDGTHCICSTSPWIICVVNRKMHALYSIGTRDNKGNCAVFLSLKLQTYSTIKEYSVLCRFIQSTNPLKISRFLILRSDNFLSKCKLSCTHWHYIERNQWRQNSRSRVLQLSPGLLLCPGITSVPSSVE